jgi:5-amino-6-(D-ribitylamino)uracil---L-tyrosine 4-hydroxyphenyl transferase
MDLHRLLHDISEGRRMTETEAAALLNLRGREVFSVLAAADNMREKKAGNLISYVRNQNIHITNICKNLCGFCGFGKSPGDEGAYCNDREEIEKKVALAVEREVTEICLLSGVHPDFTIESYEDILGWVTSAAPGVHIHAFSPDEVAHASDRGGISTTEVLERMRNAGLGSLQGTAAEILVDDVRSVICPNKLNTEKWTQIIREAHRMNIPTTATIMYGSYENAGDRAKHLAILRDIQDETGGFTELVPLTYIHAGTPLYQQGIANAGATGMEDILLIAVSRLFLDNFKNIQVSWGKLGLKMSELALASGANDFAGTLFADDVSRDAGAESAEYLDPLVMERIAKDLGRPLRQRTTLYRLL